MNRLSNAYFEDIYRDEDDPWGFASKWYEARKYALTLAALPRKRYERAFEPGCAIGVLSEQLASRCDLLVASDPMAKVAELAKKRLARFRGAEVRTSAIPDQWPDGSFDLVVLSEVAYYLTHDGVDALLARIDGSLDEGGHVVAVHYTKETDYPLTGDAVHQRFDAHARWTRLAHYREESFVLAVYESHGR